MSDFTDSLVVMKDAVNEMKATSEFYEEKSKEVSNLITQVQDLLSTFILEVPSGDKYLLLFPLSGGDFQFHGSFSLMNYTSPFVCDLNIKKSYNSKDVFALSQIKFGNIGVSVCSLTYEGVEYLALRNDGEDNRVWRFMGQLSSSEYIRSVDKSNMEENSVSVLLSTEALN